MDDKNLLVHFKRLRCESEDTTNFNFFDFVHAKGSPLDALFYSRLFWPKFVEIDGMVFLKETIEDGDDELRLYNVLKNYNGDKTKTEKSFNLVEVPSLFGKNLDQTTDEEDKVLADRLSKMWSYKLHMIYPGRKFVVKVLQAEDTGGEVGVMFYTCRDNEPA